MISILFFLHAIILFLFPSQSFGPPCILSLSLLYLELIYYFIFNYHHHHHHLIHQHGCNGFQVCLLANSVSTTQHTQILSLSHLIIHLSHSLFFVSLFGQCTHTHLPIHITSTYTMERKQTRQTITTNNHKQTKDK